MSAITTSLSQKPRPSVFEWISHHWFETFLDNLAPVTVDDVQRVARAYFKPALRNVGVYLPSGNGGAENE